MHESELIEKISLAFSDVEYPGNENLVKDSYGEEPDLVKNHFLGHKDWKKLTPEFIDFDGALSFLSDKALHFYIPAFLIADINRKLEYNDPAIRLCSALTPQSENVKIAKIYGGGTIAERVKKCFDEFSKEQVNAIVSYLHWKLLQDEFNLTIKQALENYWLQREKNMR